MRFETRERRVRDPPAGGFGIPVDELLCCRHVVDEPGDHAAGPGAGVDFALLHDLRVDSGHLGEDVLELQLGLSWWLPGASMQGGGRKDGRL